MDSIAIVMEGHRARRQDKHYGIIFVPHRTVICEHVLDTRGLLGSNVNVYDYKLDLIPIDTDLLSMELDYSFNDCYVKGDPTVLYFIAK